MIKLHKEASKRKTFDRTETFREKKTKVFFFSLDYRDEKKNDKKMIVRIRTHRIVKK